MRESDDAFQLSIDRDAVPHSVDKDGWVVRVPTEASAMLTGTRSDGQRITVELSEYEARSLVAAEDRDAEALRILDCAAEDRWHS